MQAGLNSAAAIQFASYLRAACSISLSPTLIFEHPTPRAIAAHLAALGAPEELCSPQAILAALEEHFPRRSVASLNSMPTAGAPAPLSLTRLVANLFGMT